MKKFFPAALAVILMISLTGPAPAGEETPQAIGYISTPNTGKTLDDLVNLIEKLNLPNGGMVVFRAYLGGLLENPTLSGVDLKGPLAIVFFNPSGKTDSWAAGFRLNNPDSYLKVLEKSLSLKKTDRESGVRTYTKETQVFDREAYLKADSEDRKDLDRFNKDVITTISLALKGNTAWLTTNPELIEAVREKNLSDFRAPVSTNLALVFEVEPLLEIVRPKFEDSLSRLDQAAEEGSKGGRSLRQILGFYLHYARQIKEGTIGITADADGIVLKNLIRAEAGSGVGEFLREQKPGRLSLARFLEPEALLIADGLLRKPEMLLGPTEKLFSIYGTTCQAEDFEALRKAWLESSETYFRAVGDETALSLSSRPGLPMAASMVQSLKDPAAYRAYIQTGFPAIYQQLKPFYDEQGITYDFTGLEEPRKFQGVEIYTLKSEIDREKFLKASVKDETDKKFLEALPEGPMIMEWAVWKNLAVSHYTWGEGGKIDPLLERVMAGQRSLRLRDFTGSRRRLNGAVYLSLDRLCRFGERFINRFADKPKGQKGTAMLRKLAKLDLPLLWTITVDEEKVEAETRIPVEKINSIKEVIAPSKP